MHKVTPGRCTRAHMPKLVSVNPATNLTSVCVRCVCAPLPPIIQSWRAERRRTEKTKSKSAQPTSTLNGLGEGEGRGHRKETEVKFVAKWIDFEVGVARNKLACFLIFPGPSWANTGRSIACMGQHIAYDFYPGTVTSASCDPPGSPDKPDPPDSPESPDSAGRRSTSRRDHIPRGCRTVFRFCSPWIIGYRPNSNNLIDRLTQTVR